MFYCYVYECGDVEVECVGVELGFVMVDCVDFF